MKLMMMALTTVFGIAAQAATADVCTNFIPCGEYEGTGNWYDVNNTKKSEYGEKIVISPVDATTASLKVYFFKPGTAAGSAWTESTMKFQPNGQALITSDDGVEFGTGYCKDQVCTIAFAPVNVEDSGTPFINSFVNTLRFEGKTLKRYNMVANSAVDSELIFQRSELTKK